jgi:hypothetical protein
MSFNSLPSGPGRPSHDFVLRPVVSKVTSILTAETASSTKPETKLPAPTLHAKFASLMPAVMDRATQMGLATKTMNGSVGIIQSRQLTLHVTFRFSRMSMNRGVKWHPPLRKRQSEANCLVS